MKFNLWPIKSTRHKNFAANEGHTEQKYTNNLYFNNKLGLFVNDDNERAAPMIGYWRININDMYVI